MRCDSDSTGIAGFARVMILIRSGPGGLNFFQRQGGGTSRWVSRAFAFALGGLLPGREK